MRLLIVIMLILFSAFFLLSQQEETFTTPPKLYKILPISLWEKSQIQGKLFLESSDKDFIHLSEEGQFRKIIEKYYANQEVVILVLDPTKFTGRLVKEVNPGGKQKYYHLYDGEIPIDAVLEVL